MLCPYATVIVNVFVVICKILWKIGVNLQEINQKTPENKGLKYDKNFYL